MNGFAKLGLPALLLLMLCTCLFFTVAGVFVITLSRSLGQRRSNDRAPRQSVPVTVVAKRTDVTGYYVTFESDAGERAELSVDAKTCGLLIEGDAGTLTLQGTRYIGFERRKNA